LHCRVFQRLHQKQLKDKHPKSQRVYLDGDGRSIVGAKGRYELLKKMTAGVYVVNQFLHAFVGSYRQQLPEMENKPPAKNASWFVLVPTELAG
jgi:hypothetical protein